MQQAGLTETYVGVCCRGAGRGGVRPHSGARLWWTWTAALHTSIQTPGGFVYSLADTPATWHAAAAVAAAIAPYARAFIMLDPVLLKKLDAGRAAAVPRHASECGAQSPSPSPSVAAATDDMPDIDHVLRALQWGLRSRTIATFAHVCIPYMFPMGGVPRFWYTGAGASGTSIWYKHGGPVHPATVDLLRVNRMFEEHVLKRQPSQTDAARMVDFSRYRPRGV